MKDLRGALAFFIGVLALGAALWVVGLRVLKLTIAADAEVVAQLKHREREGIEVPVPGSSEPLRSTRVRFDRIAVMPEENGDLRVSCTMDFTGRWGGVVVSSLGLERLRFLRKGMDWAPDRSWAPRLAQILATLEARRAALEAGDTEALVALAEGAPPDEPEQELLQSLLHRRYQVTAWYLRSERESVRVREEFRVLGDGADQPVDRSGVHSLILVPRADRFFFSQHVR